MNAPLPDPRRQEGEVATILAALSWLRCHGQDWPHAPDVSHCLRDEFGIHIHWRRIQTILKKNSGNLVTKRKRNGRVQFLLLGKGEKHVSQQGAEVVIVDPSRALQSVVGFHDTLGGLSGAVRICDPYLDAASIEHLDALPAQIKVKYLTYNIQGGEGTIRRTIAAFEQSGRTLEVRCPKKAVLHDRYLIDRNGMLLMGTSLNGLGKKQSFIVRLGQDIRKVMLSQFDTTWSAAGVWS